MHTLLTSNTCWNILNFRKQLVEHFISRGHYVSVAAPKDQSSEALRRLGCQILPLNLHPTSTSSPQDCRALSQYIQILERKTFDVIFSYTIKCNLLAAAAARLTQTPMIPNITGIGTAFAGNGRTRRLAELLYRHTLRKCPIIFFQNPDDKDFFVTHGLAEQRQSIVLPGSGVDLDAFSFSPIKTREKTTFLMIARLLKSKGIFEYLTAASAVKREYHDVTFQLIGQKCDDHPDGIPFREISKYFDRGCINFLGTQDDVRPFIRNADCIVLPSYREGAPRSLLEAAASGRPAITTDTAGCRFVVKHKQTGLLCSPRSAVSLEIAVRDFLKMPFRVRQLFGLRARQKAEAEFDVRFVIRQYEMAARALSK